jgi:osmoprotectant transport system substrate-binding protein
MRLSRGSAGAVAAVALGAGLLSGCATAAFSAGQTGAITTATTSTTVTNATSTQPVVTAVTTPTPVDSHLPGTGKPVIHLGDMATQEQFIIGQLYEVALAQEGYTVYLNRNVGGPFTNRIPALHHGTLDIYPEYLGQWNSSIAHLHRRFKTLAASFGAGEAYAHRRGVTLLPPTPFSNTSCVAVLSQYAAENHVYSIPELAHGPGIIFGSPLRFQFILDGLPRLRRGYHLHPAYVQAIGNTEQYWWLNTGNVQAAYCTTTDPQLNGPKYVQLADPKHIFGYGNVVPVTTQSVLKAEGPAFRKTIKKIDSLLTLRAMRGLDAEIELGGHDPTNIAYQFLAGNRVIIPPARYAPVPTTTTTSPTTTTGTQHTS